MMEIFINILKLLAGIGMFLFAMHLMEESLKNISGRNFKLFLQRITKNRFGAVAGGALVTGILQSSSMVSLMVLALVGAGVFTMKNAMAIILGANLGTTLDSWVVATLGFKVNIEVVAYPAVCAGGLLLILLGNRRTIKYLSYFLLGFGLLFIALAFMKTAMEMQVKEFDFSKYYDLPLVVFLLIGFVITLIIQSSSATMAIALSALNTGVIGFAPAAALVLGSETGTTIKILISAIGGNASKKRVVLGNFLFNIFLTGFAFALLKPILLLITDVFKIKDPLIGLVTFSSLTNLISILIFLPLLNPFARFLEKFFKNTDASAAAFVANASVSEPQTALDLFRREVEYFIHNSILFNLEQLEIKTELIEEHSDFRRVNERKNFMSKPDEEKYEFLKQLQGELQSFYLELRVKFENKEAVQINQLISAVRSSMYSVKSLRDIGTNIGNLKRSSKNIKFYFLLDQKTETADLYAKLNAYMTKQEKVDFKKLQNRYDDVQTNYCSALSEFYKAAQHAPIEDIDLTIVINFNRELFTSNKAMLMAVKDFLLEEKEANEFNEIPVYKSHG